MGKSLLVGNGINIQFGGYMMSKTIAIKNRGGRNDYLDLLKAIAIVAVVFYHIGNLPRGYLGVDIFFVISGYFMMHGYMNNRSKPGYLANIIKRIIRFWPLILFCIVSCLIIGAVTMLPDDFENLGESAVASVFFMNNILSAITTRNYWNISNNYKPLMHLWYIGVLLQAYIVLPFVFTIVDKIRKQYLKVAVVIITVTSLLLFLCPTFSSTAKFYYLPFRIFEISCGCCICFFSFMDKLKDKWLLIIKSVSIILITLILIIDTSIIPDELYLLSIVVLTYFYVISVTRSQVNHFPENIKWLKPVTFLGKASFSIYIAHQPIIAFTRYLYMSDISGVTLFIVLLLILLISILSYQFFEKNIGNCLKQFNCFKIFAYMSVVAVIVCVSGLAIYLKAGVIRDVPELDVYVDSAYRGMNAEYVDIPYSWDEDFEDDKKYIF